MISTVKGGISLALLSGAGVLHAVGRLSYRLAESLEVRALSQVHDDDLELARELPPGYEVREVGPNGLTMIVHGEDLCTPPCPVHAPSEHHMVDWPIWWRGDRGIFERICDHGIGHPDPDTLTYLLTEAAVHGCDGCCQGSTR